LGREGREEGLEGGPGGIGERGPGSGESKHRTLPPKNNTSRP
jgi:hypothetical protein